MIKDTCFAADPSLGKLCKWLRVLGFDTLYERNVSGGRCTALAKEGRCLLTRMTALKDFPHDGRLLFIRSNDPFKQLKQVVEEIGISLADLRPFSRCIRCNQPVSTIEKSSVQNRVPDYVWETAENFRQCPECKRIYWQGSHSRQVHQRIAQVFEGQGTIEGYNSNRVGHD